MDNYFQTDLKRKITDALNKTGYISFLTGAGISVDSGIPTFRGPEGYWTIGSENYMPEEMATLRMFNKNPFEVWKWYLYRFGICRQAEPNSSHAALVKLEQELGEQFRLITQNIDGLHHRAGNSLQHLLRIHGDINSTRCSVGCTDELYPLPAIFVNSEETFTATQFEQLKCPKCEALLRPHVLWFDESYNEQFYKFDTAIQIAKQTNLLIIIGTTGATNLPRMFTEIVRENKGIILDINPHKGYFSQLSIYYQHGYFIQAKSSEVLPELVQLITAIKQNNETI